MSGPLSAAIATLAPYGWHMGTPQLWQHTKYQFSISTGAPIFLCLSRFACLSPLRSGFRHLNIIVVLGWSLVRTLVPLNCCTLFALLAMLALLASSSVSCVEVVWLAGRVAAAFPETCFFYM